MKFHFILFLFLSIIPLCCKAGGMVGFGGAKIPSYLGSATTESRPIGFLNYDIGHSFIEIEGPEVLTNIYLSKKFSVGPIVSLDFGRDALKHSSISQSQLTELPFNYDIGLMSQLHLPTINFSDEDEFVFRFSTQGNNKSFKDAHTYRFIFQYFFKVTFFLRTELEFEYKYSNSNYLNYFFGVDRNISEQTSLRAYTPKAGSESLQLSQNIIFSFSEAYGFLLKWSNTYYQQQAKQSPYVKDFGNSKNTFVGVAIFYRWN